eukprot:3356245-Pleurochrysis_carterae.AAC.1
MPTRANIKTRARACAGRSPRGRKYVRVGVRGCAPTREPYERAHARGDARGNKWACRACVRRACSNFSTTVCAVRASSRPLSIAVMKGCCVVACATKLLFCSTSNSRDSDRCLRAREGKRGDGDGVWPGVAADERNSRLPRSGRLSS